MRRKVNVQAPVIEWSTSGVQVWVPGATTVQRRSSLAEAIPLLGGTTEVVVALSRRTSFVRAIRLPDAPKHDVARTLQLQIGTLFPVTPSEVSVDFAMTTDKSSEGRLCVVGAVKTATLLALTQELSAHGLRARNIVPVALGSSLLAEALGKSECAVVESAPEGLAVDVISEGQLRASRVAPMPSAELIGVEVSRSFAVANVPCAETIATGNFAFPDADLVLKESALQYLGTAELPIHLELRELVERRERQRAGRTHRVALLIWACALVYAGVVWDERSTLAAKYGKGEIEWKKRVANLKTIKNQAAAKVSSLEGISRTLDLGFQPSQRLSDVVRVVSNLSPEGLWLTGISLERGKPLTLRGTATSNEPITRYLDALSGQSRFRDVKLVYANKGQIEKTNVVQFSISAHVVGNLPLDSGVLK